jgi:hypothetical protein
MNRVAIASTACSGSVPLDLKIKQVGDVNGHGKADIIWLNLTIGTVAVWLMKGETIKFPKLFRINLLPKGRFKTRPITTNLFFLPPRQIPFIKPQPQRKGLSRSKKNERLTPR